MAFPLLALPYVPLQVSGFLLKHLLQAPLAVLLVSVQVPGRIFSDFHNIVFSDFPFLSYDSIQSKFQAPDRQSGTP